MINMKSALLAIIAVTVSSTIARADEVKYVSQNTGGVGAGGSITVDIACPAGFDPEGVKGGGTLYHRIEGVTANVAHIRVFNPAGPQGGSTITDLIYLTCVKS